MMRRVLSTLSGAKQKLILPQSIPAMLQMINYNVQVHIQTDTREAGSSLARLRSKHSVNSLSGRNTSFLTLKCESLRSCTD
jgi:hypothetical protein